MKSIIYLLGIVLGSLVKWGGFFEYVLNMVCYLDEISIN